MLNSLKQFPEAKTLQVPEDVFEVLKRYVVVCYQKSSPVRSGSGLVFRKQRTIPVRSALLRYNWRSRLSAQIVLVIVGSENQSLETFCVSSLTLTTR